VPHVLRNTTSTISVTFSAGPADGPVTYAAVDEAGAAVAAGTATHVGATGEYTYSLAPQAALKRCQTAWTGTWGGAPNTIETDFEIVEAHLFTVAEARAFGDGQLNDTNVYSDAEIREARDRTLDTFQACCGVPFVPRYERETVDGSGKVRLWLPWKRPLTLISVKIDGVALTAPELAAVSLYVTGRIERDAGWTSGKRNVVVEWERGYRQAPAEIKRAALALAHYELISSDITDRMVTVANELGTVRLSVPGRNAPTGIPLIDSALYRYDERDTLQVAIR
jgi:hypothetical protein